MYSQNNLEELYKLIGQIPNQQFFSGPNYDFIKTHNSIWPNLIFNLKASKKKVESLLDKIEIKTTDYLIPNIIVCNHTKKNEHLINVLNRRNYDYGIWIAMYHNLKLSKPKNLNPDLQIKRVKNHSDLTKWLALVESELMGNKKLNSEIFIELLKNYTCHFYMGIVNGKTVATSLLYITNLSAGIYLVSTNKNHRNKGIGTAITYFTLCDAEKLKCQNVHIQATNSGLNLYKSLGFKGEEQIYVFKIRTIKNYPKRSFRKEY